VAASTRGAPLLPFRGRSGSDGRATFAVNGLESSTAFDESGLFLLEIECMAGILLQGP